MLLQFVLRGHLDVTQLTNNELCLRGTGSWGGMERRERERERERVSERKREREKERVLMTVIIDYQFQLTWRPEYEAFSSFLSKLAP